MRQANTPDRRRSAWQRRHRRPAPDPADETEEAERHRGRLGREVKERHEKLDDDVDAILDEIDEVLEKNAEEFVRSFVQKGGQ